MFEMKIISSNKVLQNISWLLFDKIFFILLNLLVVIRVANYYGPSEYGLYQYALSIVTLLGTLILFVDGRVVKTQYYTNEQGHVIYNTTIAKAILSLGSIIVGLVLMFLMNKGVKFNTIYFLLLINNLFINIGFGIQSYFEYKLKSKTVVLVANFVAFIAALLQLIATFFNYSILMIVVIIATSSLVKVILLFIQFNRIFHIKLSFKADSALIMAIIKESIPLALAATAATVYRRIDQVMIGAMLNVKEVGLYAMSSSMIGAVEVLIGPIQVSIFPKMIEWYYVNKELYYKRYQAITSLTTWLYIFGLGLSFLLTPIVFRLFLSAEYSRSLNIFNIHILGSFFMYNAVLRSSHYTLTKDTHIMMYSQLAAVLLNIILNLILIPIIGIIGAAIATTVTQGISLLISNYFFIKGKKVFWLQLKGINPLYIRWFK
jgi:O-antigen/teichoic acid export membrane protein